MPHSSKESAAERGRSGGWVMVVEDDLLLRGGIVRRLQHDGHRVVEAGTAREARAALETMSLDAVLLDSGLPDSDDELALLREIHARHPDVPVVLLTDQVVLDTAIQAIKEGAFQYICKPADLDEVAIMIGRALAASALQREVRMLRRAQSGAGSLRALVGSSPQMRRVTEIVRRYAASPASTVLITGETGTGKDLVAHALHLESARVGGPFTNITCSALTETLLENELFGHERGAFTGAHATKRGLLEISNGGTVFLDEIGEMSPMLQAKLLRFLESKTCRRVGGTQDITTNVRVVAATNRDFEAEIVAGRFREDLFYRLSVLRVELPPLRDRMEDLAPLLEHFIDGFNREFAKQVRGVTPAAMTLLEAYDWPGNVRELRNVIERAVLLSDEDTISEAALTIPRAAPERSAPFELPAQGIDLDRLEADLLRQALARTHGNQSQAARLLGLTRDQVRYRLSKSEPPPPSAADDEG